MHDEKSKRLKRRIHSFVWGGIAALFWIVAGICAMSDNINGLWGGLILAVPSFTFLSCLILNNNFIIDILIEVFSWGFVQMPGIIFELDLDGIIFLLTVKLLFWILGILLALLCGLLAVALGLICSLFVYPFALYKNITGKEA